MLVIAIKLVQLVVIKCNNDDNELTILWMLYISKLQNFRWLRLVLRSFAVVLSQLMCSQIILKNIPLFQQIV